MALSLNAVKRLMIALTDKTLGAEVANAINQGAAAASQDPWVLAAVIVATNVSTTIDFAAIKAGDKLVHIPAVAGNAAFEAVVTNGAKPSAAIVGDLYIALRAFAAPANTTAKL